MATPEVYFDLNDTIYTMLAASNNLNSPSSKVLTFGLSDMAELPGQSSIYVNSLTFKLQGFTTGGVSPGADAQGQWVAGIIQRDLVNSQTFNDVKDFQDYLGWPLKMCYGYWLVQGNHGSSNSATADWPRSGNAFSITKTFKPRKALLLNREQNIVLTLQNVAGDQIYTKMSICGQFKRGN